MQFPAFKPLLRFLVAVCAGLLWCLVARAASAPLLRIMPLGDSITDGSPVPGGYRARLYQLLTNAAYNVDFIGTLSNNFAASLPDPNHEGHSGWRIDQLRTEFSGWAAALPDPDVILLLIGTNDYGQNHDPTNAIHRLDALIGDITLLRPQARIIVANLLRRTDNSSLDAAIQASFNPYVLGVVTNHAAQGRLVYFLDLRSALGATDLADGLHPNQTGYNKMATNWFAAVRQLIAPYNGAGSQLITFDGLGLNGSFSSGPMPTVYQPVPGLLIGYSNVNVFNAGPDHTSGIAGGSHYNACGTDPFSPLVFTFSKPVGIQSAWLATALADQGSQRLIGVKAFADPGGSGGLLTNLSLTPTPRPAGGGYAWAEFTQLLPLGSNIMRLEFSGDMPQVDDLLLAVSTNRGALQSLSLALDSTTLYTNIPQRVRLTARYDYAPNVNASTNAGAVYSSSNTNVVTIGADAIVRAVAVGSATITATLDTLSTNLVVSVVPGCLMDFNTGLSSLGDLVTLPFSYQPISGVSMTCSGVGLINSGPDHTTGISGANRYNGYQFVAPATPQVFTFSKPVSIPSLWLASSNGSGGIITIRVYSDRAGASLLGATTFAPPRHPAGSPLIWAQCTNLNTPAFNGRISRLQVSCPDNAQVDDVTVILKPAPTPLATLVSTKTLTVSWSTNYSNALLMTTPALSPSALWAPVTNTPFVSGPNYQVTVPLCGISQFFRLEY